MKKSKGLTKAPVSRQKRHNATAANSKTAQLPKHSINLDPAIFWIRRFNDEIRRRLLALALIAFGGISLWSWNYSDIRRVKAAEPYLKAICNLNMVAEGYSRRHASYPAHMTCEASKAIVYDFDILAEALSDDCRVYTTRMTKLERWWLDRNTRNSTSPPAKPQPEGTESIQAQVASYQERSMP